MAARLFHTILALSVLISTTGLTLSSHYCQDRLQGVSLFAKAENCHPAQPKSCCSQRQGCVMHQEQEHNNCCSNTTDYYKLEQEKVQTGGVELIKSPEFLSAIPPTTGLSLVISGSDLPCQQVFKPPIVCTDLQVRLQTFRL